MMSRNGLLQRLLRVMLVTVLPVFLIHVSVQVASDVDAASQRAFNGTQSLASATVPLLQAALVRGDLTSVQQTLDNIMRHGQFNRLSLVNEQTGELLASGDGPEHPPGGYAPGWFRAVLSVHFEAQRFPVQAGIKTYGTLLAEPSAAFLVADLWRRMWTAIALWTATLIVLLLFLKRSLRAGLRPLHDLAIAVRRFGEGELAVRAPTCNVPELAATAKAFNRMADNLEEAQDKLEARVRQRTAELAAREAHTSAILHSLHDAVLKVGGDGTVRMANPAACQIFGHSGGTLSGLPIVRLMPDMTPACLPRLASEAEGRSDLRPAEAIGVREDGRSFPVELSVARLVSADEDCFVVVLRDVTGQREIENAREFARKNAEHLAKAKSEFLANMSHEIRTPLNAILGFAQVGLRKSHGGPFGETFEQILHSGELLLGLINDVLDFSKIEAHKLQLEAVSFDLGEVVDRAVEMLAAQAHAKGLDLIVSEAPGLPLRTVGDAFRLTQVLVNLLSNAIKFTAQGQVRLEVGRVSGALFFRIHDSGVGMSPEVLGRLFAPFEQADSSITRRFGGTGLGLVISHRLVERMGGSLEVDSAPGRGTCMTVRLPPAEDQEPGPERPPLDVMLLGFAGSAASELCLNAPADVRIGSVPGDQHCPQAPGLKVRIAAAHLATSVASLPGEGPVLVLSSPGEPITGGDVPEASTPHLAWPLRWRHVWRLLGQAPQTGGAIPPPPILAGLRVLAAEDDPANRLVLREILELAGARLVAEENGRVACERLQREGGEAFDLMITDLQMPVMDGFATAREVRRLAPRLPVIGLSAHVLPEEREHCLSAGMVELLTKPVSVDELLAALAHHLPQEGRPVSILDDPMSKDGELVDWQRLEQCFSRGKDLVAQLAETIRESASVLPGALREAAAAGDDQALARLSHRIAGMGANLMARRLHDDASHVEAAARSALPAGRKEALALADLLEQLLAEIDRRAPVAGPRLQAPDPVRTACTQ
ncbi:ATP-binding protein [Zoogloea dura]|uniref:Virulence sensor protein BvgS n=1 Tax=Zoogloea dura TaxID=2728840 RepID=A0A848G5B0_9RHOO|nr:ATP-binding protein [Zoogloea dura]NML26125.1 response regulator [Zoogloea dura]